MATEAFDPFAFDDEDDDDLLHGATTTTPRHSNSSVRYSPKVIPSPRGSPRPRDHASNNTSVSSSGPRDRQIDDILGEFRAVFRPLPAPSVFDDDDAKVDEFGFPPVDWAAAFGVGELDEAHARGTSSTYPCGRPSLEGVTFILAEEMSIIHKSKTNECSVKVRGNISLEEPSDANRNQRISCDVSFRDPEGHLGDISASKKQNYARQDSSGNVYANNPGTFHLYMSEQNSEEDTRFGRPLIEYTCGDKLQPVPLLMNASVEVLHDRCRVMIELRVNPRNAKSLLNAVMLICVPKEYDGEQSRVSAVGRSIGKGEIDSSWGGITRILSWRMGELYSGAICEFEALFLTGSDEDPLLDEMNGPSSTADFPVLLRYDCEGSSLSDVDLDFGDSQSVPLVKRKFRVYHREV